MTKTGQYDEETFITVTSKRGSEAFTLYVTYTADGPEYDAVCIDAEIDEIDEIEINFTDGCASFNTADLNYVMLRPKQLRALALLVEESEDHYEGWLETTMGQDFKATPDDDNENADFFNKYKDVFGVRSKA